MVIDPLFNRFQPLQDKALDAKILALADRAGIEGGRVYEVNKSVDTKTLNAYVNGFMGSKRIVFWDTALRLLNEDELLAVMGHEMGHYVLGHVVQSLLFSAAMLLAGLYAAHRVAAVVLGRFKERFGFTTLQNFAALPLMILLLNLLNLLSAPLQLAFSRHQEHEADRFGLELTHNNHAAATAFLKLQQHNLSNPRPGFLYKLWRASHPPIGERIDFCNRYRPWETGAPSKYADYLKSPAQ
jgi:Zn-dependent protease with chaperone function